MKSLQFVTIIYSVVLNYLSVALRGQFFLPQSKQRITLRYTEKNLYRSEKVLTIFYFNEKCPYFLYISDIS